MGKAGRVACIFTPMLLTIASLVSIALIEVGGWNNSLDSYYFFSANLTNLSVDSSSSSATSQAIGEIKTASGIGEIYNVYLWNYCDSNNTDGSDKTCSGRASGFVFDPIEVWGLNSTSTNSTSTSSSTNAVQSAVSSLESSYEQKENELLGKSGKKALDAYRSIAKWMFIAYQISFWTTVATVFVGIFAIFSRWGSLLTWILSIVSSFFTIAAVLTSTILFSVLVKALNEVLNDYGITLAMGRNALVAGWAGVGFSWGATLFWLFSVCCCSGRSNPHHKSNKGGLWNAEPKGQGYGYGADYARGRGLKVEKTGGGYQRVASPYMGGHEHGDQVPLHDYQQPGPHTGHQDAGFEPYRHT